MSGGAGEGEAPKIRVYLNKPTKRTRKPRVTEMLNQSQPLQMKTPPTTQSSSSSSNIPTSYTLPPPPPPPPLPPTAPPPPKESFARRYKFLWPLLLTVNLAVGAYIFTRTRTKKKDEIIEEGAVPTTSPAAVAASVSEKAATPAAVAASTSEKPVTPAAVTEPAKLHEPIPEDQQREFFKWLLEEKRKVKTKDREEKKRIDEEKALLKQFIRAKSIPSL